MTFRTSRSSAVSGLGHDTGPIPQSVTSVAMRTRIDSRELLAGERELIIQHGDQEYRLRHTQNDKLILTK
jgi:hemin uptake protein HemP